MSDWKPMESAPTWRWEGDKNISPGRPEIIVGWAGTSILAFAYWSPTHEDEGGGGEWRIVGGGPMPPPTHWTPLPAPPEA